MTKIYVSRRLTPIEYRENHPWTLARQEARQRRDRRSRTHRLAAFCVLFLAFVAALVTAPAWWPL